MIGAHQQHYHDCTLTSWSGEPDRCRWCDTQLQGRRTVWCSNQCADRWPSNHLWTWARAVRKRTDRWRCIQCGSKTSLEVNHITPILGRHAKAGCWHHQNGLETLCHAHHLEITKQQNSERRSRLRQETATAQSQLAMDLNPE